MTQGDDPRDVSITQRLASGRETVLKLHIPMPLYLGIWDEAHDYAKGDVVTYGGSIWYCLVDQTKARPGIASKDWRLMVKEGRAGKDGKDGVPGSPGRPGKDLIHGANY
jgi:hypothetical protein